jgi:hypothetical protein
MNQEFLTLHVECHAGYRGEETPRRFHIGTRNIEVIEVIDRWISPDHRYFKVLGNDEGIYILRYDTSTNRWELTMFDARGLKQE